MFTLLMKKIRKIEGEQSIYLYRYHILASLYTVVNSIYLKIRTYVQKDLSGPIRHTIS